MLTQEQLEFRKTGLGGSDISAVLGLNPWRSPVDVFLEKTGQVEPDDISDKPAVHWGNVLEDLVAAEFSNVTGLKVRRENKSLRHPKHEWAIAHLDRRVLNMPWRTILECKTAGDRMASSWGPEGTDQVPDYYLAQVVHYMAVTEAEIGRVAVLIGGRDFRTYTIRRDRAVEREVLARCASFWRDNVLAGVAPPPRTAAQVQALYPQDSGATVVADSETLRLYQELAEVKARGKEIGARQVELEEAIKLAMGQHSVLTDEAGEVLCTWKAPKPGKQFDRKGFEAAHPDLAAQFTNEAQGSRRFSLK